MATYTLTMHIEATRKESVEKKLRQAFGKDIPIHEILKDTTPESRAQQLSEAESDFENAKSTVEGLRDEMENWEESIPENLQGGSKHDEVVEAKDALQEIIDSMENVSFDNVDFPGMF